MNRKTFLDVPKEECSDVYKIILNNSDRKWDAGIVLMKGEYYDLAISMALISTEELIKAIIVFANGKGFEFGRVKGMKRFFSDHSIRFVIAYGMFALNDLQKDLMAYIIQYRGNSDIIKQLLDELKDIERLFVEKLKPYFLRKIALYHEELDWFSKMEIMRQEGFYCDYQEQLKNPLEISKQKCVDVYERLIGVRIMGKELIQSYDSNDEMYKNQLEYIMQEWDQRDYYQKLDNLLTIFKKSSGNPFDILKKQLQ